MAQKITGSIKGKLTDSTYKEQLAEATVSVMLVQDSTLVSFKLSNDKGESEIKDLDTGSYRLMISYQGYQPVSQAVQHYQRLLQYRLSHHLHG